MYYGGGDPFCVRPAHIVVRQYTVCIANITIESICKVLPMLAALMNTILCLCDTLYFSENFIISCFDTLNHPLGMIGKMLLFPVCQKIRKRIVLPKLTANVRFGTRAPVVLTSPLSPGQTWVFLYRRLQNQLDSNDMKTCRTVLHTKSGSHFAQERKNMWCWAKGPVIIFK